MTVSDDELDYLERYPEARFLGLTPAEHFRKYGKRLGYKYAHANTELVLNSSPKTANLVPAARFEEPVPVILDEDLEGGFDAEFYLDKNQDVLNAGLDPRSHYFQDGWRERRDPNSWFSTAFYLSQYADVVLAGVEPFRHYLYVGRNEGRYPSYTSWYSDRNKRLLQEKTPLFRLHRRINSDVDLIENSIAVHLHCFYADVFLQSILPILRLLPNSIVLFISVCDEPSRAAVEFALKQEAMHVGRIAIVENRGRDIAPLLLEFGAELSAFDLCLHIHTKKSVEKAALGSRWLSNMKRTLLGSSGFIRNSILLMLGDDSIGLVGPRPYREMRQFMTWGANYHLAEELMARADIGSKLLRSGLLDFPAGSFFWFKPPALQKLLEIDMKLAEFPAEPIPDDGTIAHAIERVLPVFALDAGFRYVEVEPISFEAVNRYQQTPDISVVIPVYNAEPFIEATILSLLNRSSFHYQLEIIAVDNNSTDGSLRVLQRLSRLFPELVVISESKKGAGAARNAGFAQARGAYILFVDADDLVTPDGIGELFDCIRLPCDQDIAFATSSLQMFEGETLSRSMPFPDSGDFEILKRDQYLEQSESWLGLMRDFGACAKLYRKSFLVDNAISFPEGVNFEDNAFIGKALLAASAIAVLKKVTYLYRRGLSAPTQSTVANSAALTDQAKIVDLLIADCNLLVSSPINDVYLEVVLDKLIGEAERMNLKQLIPHIVSDLPFAYKALVQSEKWSAMR